MKLNKKKVFTLALSVCMLAILSLGSLAWFTDQDAVTNDFLIAGSDGEDADDIFSVEVEEDSTDPDATKTEDGIQYDKILPGDTLSKIVNVTNTGSYNQYIRVKITVSNAKLWQELYQANMVPVTEFVDLDEERADLYGVGSYLDQETDSFVYYLYFTEELAPEASMNVFNNAFVAGALTQQQAYDIGGKFTIKVSADAVQTENVGDNVYEAFKTVGMEIPVNTTFVKTYDELNSALTEDGYIVLMDNVAFPFNTVKVNSGVTVNLYLNDYILSTVNNTDEYRNAMYVHGDLTIGGHGTVYMPGAQGIKVENGMLSIYGGTFVDEEDRPARHTETLINVYGSGVLNVYGGTFNGTDYCVCDHAAEGELNIWGGSFAVSTDKGVAIKYWEG